MPDEKVILFLVSLILGFITISLMYQYWPETIIINTIQEVTVEVTEQINPSMTGWVSLSHFFLNLGSYFFVVFIIFGFLISLLKYLR